MKRIFWTAAILSAFACAQDSPLQISVRPQPAYIEQSVSAQLLNCDFIVTNLSDERWTLRALEVSAYDEAGRLAMRKFVNDNGNSPSVETLNRREIAAKQRILIFNPLFSFERSIPLHVLRYRFTWASENSKREITSEIAVTPEPYVGKTALRLPLAGRTLVWDGHDYYAHHRRFDYLSPHAQETGTNSNPDRYGYDLVPVSKAGEMRKGNPDENKSWFGFGQPIFAAGAGRVVAAVDDNPDNRDVDMARFAANQLADYGNYIIIDHGGGEFALYGHLQQGSSKVKAGDIVKQGQRLAAIGASGSSLMPHLHFQLQTAARADAEGLPSSFDSFVRRLGGRSLRVRRGTIDSGDIVEDGRQRGARKGLKE